ncbi:hypothetical protein N656DRAFT_67803 [Canariomyces notabilis]|uniref:Uncharacterized protein n=1 Tax=Canariomyces notabilis TaxID=2074819 RepID=A0AAN6TNS2_9PEZI|nr:hypothetical protein N656DRAFT_67803 [Canariomyces arenarius]
MASITSLANETLYWVMREFCPHCVVGCGVFGAGSGACLESLDHASVLAGDRRAEARRTLLALTRVGNRRLGRVAQLFLFHVVDTDRGDSLALLARTLAEAPALALEIRVVDLGGVAVAGSGGSAVVVSSVLVSPSSSNS